MIKFNGLNYKNGSGDRYLFGDFGYGNGSGKGMGSWYLSYYFGNGWGDGCYFGDEKGNGVGPFPKIVSLKNPPFPSGSWSSKIIKKEYQI